MAKPPSLLSFLLDHITTSVHSLQAELGQAGLPEPWLDKAQLHPWDIETPSEEYWKARITLLSSLGMLTALVQNPREKILCDGMGYHHPAVFNFIVKTRIPDILDSPDVDKAIGLSASEIARRIGTHPAKTDSERILRFLAIHHIFQETLPAVFANNRLSICFKQEDPMSQVPIYWGDISFRSATAFSRVLRDPTTAHSMKVYDSPFCAVFGNVVPRSDSEDSQLGTVGDDRAHSDMSAKIISNGDKANRIGASFVSARLRPLTAFEFLDLPECGIYRSAFARGMRTLEIMHGTSGYQDFDWRRASEGWDQPGKVFVEIGASLGHLSHTLLPTLKYTKFVNQDRPDVCEEGQKYFLQNYPEALKEGRVTFQANDFMTGQPIKGAQLYILSNILHDWPESEALTILRHIADAMSGTSRLLVLEVVQRPSLSQSLRSPDPVHQTSDHIIKTKIVEDAPWPLPKDYGIVNRYAHHQSLELINLFNGLDRTLREYKALFHQSGLTLVKVHHIRKLVSIMEVKLTGETCLAH